MRHFDLGPSEDINADEALDVLGARIRFLTALSGNSQAPPPFVFVAV